MTDFTPKERKQYQAFLDEFFDGASPDARIYAAIAARYNHDDKDRDYWYSVAEEFQTKYLALRTACEALVAAYNDDPAMPWRDVRAIEELLK